MENRDLICIGCPLGCPLTVTIENGEVTEVKGNTCPKGDAYARKEVTNPTRIVTSTVVVEGGVRYTVPATIRPSEMDDTLTVRFRVADVYKNHAICTYFDNELISKRKRPVMAPGEMEQVILTKAKLAEYPDLDRITITLEEA